MNIVKKSSLVVGVLLVCLLLTLPASLVLKNIQLDNNVKFGNVQGAWWAFNIDWLSYQGLVFESTELTLKPSCLLKASICYHADNQQAHVEIGYSLIDQSIKLSNSDLGMNLSQLEGFLKTALVKPSGYLTINVDSISIKGNELTALEADVLWDQVGVVGEAFNLGNIKAALNHQPKIITINLSDDSDKLDLSGTVKVLQSGQIQNNIQLKTLQTFPEQLKTILQSVMNKRGNNVFQYSAKLNNSKIKTSGINF